MKTYDLTHDCTAYEKFDDVDFKELEQQFTIKHKILKDTIQSLPDDCPYKPYALEVSNQLDDFYRERKLLSRSTFIKYGIRVLDQTNLLISPSSGLTDSSISEEDRLKMVSEYEKIAKSLKWEAGLKLLANAMLMLVGVLLLASVLAVVFTIPGLRESVVLGLVLSAPVISGLFAGTSLVSFFHLSSLWKVSNSFQSLISEMKINHYKEGIKDFNNGTPDSGIEHLKKVPKSDANYDTARTIIEAHKNYTVGMTLLRKGDDKAAEFLAKVKPKHPYYDSVKLALDTKRQAESQSFVHLHPISMV